MSKYIDAEWLCNELGDINMDIYTDEVKEYIDSAPTIEIVRCNDCKWYNQDEYSGIFRCYRGLVDVTADDFCSYGEREAEA